MVLFGMHNDIHQQFQFDSNSMLVVLNRKNFEWNNSSSPFNQLFKDTVTALDFIGEFQRHTVFDPTPGPNVIRILKESCLQEIAKG